MRGAFYTSTAFDKQKQRRHERLKGKEALLSMLEKVKGETRPQSQTSDPKEAASPYYTLTPEEIVALVNGDIQRIESWVGKLNKDQAAWLWKRLRQEQ